MNMIEIAKKYLEAGLSVLPIRSDTKRPALRTWARLQEERLTPEECERAFDPKDILIAVIGGKVSGNLEIIDFDNHCGTAKEIFEDFTEYIDTFDLPWEKTQSGGYHVFIRRTGGVEGNHKIAKSFKEGSEKPETIIETRGEKGYAVCAPSKGYNMQNGSLLEIPIIGDEVYSDMMEHLKKWNEVDDSEYSNEPIVQREYIPNMDRAGDQYLNDPGAENECRTLLTMHGWKFDRTGKNVMRPGKTKGYSATFGRVKSRNGYPLFYVFSSNASPFEDGKCYNMFALFTILEYNGDYTASAKELYSRYKELVQSPRPKDSKITLPVTTSDERPEAPEFNKNKRKNLLPIEKVLKYLTTNYNFRYDIVRNIVESRRIGDVEWDTANPDQLFIELLAEGIKFGKDAVKSLLNSNFVERYDPLSSYFNCLPSWDGINHIKNISTYLTFGENEDPDYFTKMLEKHMVRAIKCALEQDYYNRFVFVFQSRRQEFGKSRIVRFINPFGHRYYTEEFLTSDKDSAIALSEVFIYNLDDIEEIHKQAGGLGKLKQLLARAGINVRLPYGSQKVYLPRRCTFFGSSNPGQILVDDVNTRWLIFEINDIDDRIFSEVNINFAWAQAFALYNDPTYQYELTDSEKEIRESKNLNHKQMPMEQQTLAEYFRPTDDKWLSINKVCRELANLAPFRQRFNVDPTYIGGLLDAMGYKSKTRITMGTIIREYNIELAVRE